VDKFTLRKERWKGSGREPDKVVEIKEYVSINPPGTDTVCRTIVKTSMDYQYRYCM
jgi:hypothetical protein